MPLEEKLEKLMISSQERSQFSENPDAFIKRKCEEYYKRNDMMNEVASETWANWLASYMTGDEEAQEMWQKIMPSTDKTFKEIIEEILAQDV